MSDAAELVRVDFVRTRRWCVLRKIAARSRESQNACVVSKDDEDDEVLLVDVEPNRASFELRGSARRTLPFQLRQ